MDDSLLETRSLTKTFGGVVATDDLSIDVREGELQALIGPNGAGKTTLVAQLAGEIKPDAGRILFAGEDITALPAAARVGRGLSRTFQMTQLLTGFTALENAMLAAQARSGHSFRFLRDVRHDASLRGDALQVLARVGLEDRRDVSAGDLSHGEQKQLELALALASEPRLLLLDEPMAGLGTHESHLMTDLLRSLKGQVTMLLIEHDMDVVFSLADRISVLVYGRCIARGTGDVIRADADVRNAYLGEGGV